MVKMLSLTSHIFDGRTVNAGETFESHDKFLKFLVTTGRAMVAVDAPQAPAAKLAPAPVVAVIDEKVPVTYETRQLTAVRTIRGKKGR